MTLARDERLALCALLDETGPQAPTLCEGWTTLDLAAHLVLRERRPDAAAGIMVGALAPYTRRVQRTLAQQTPFGGLVAAIRNGPPRLSPMRVAALDERTNLVEFFVHHEDIRRGAPGWTERKLSPALAEALWHQLGNARLFLHRAPVGVEFARDDVDTDPGAERVRITVKQRTPVVTVIGSPAELTLWALGRTGAAQVRLDGSEAAVRLLSERRWRRR
ncbi:MAG TPA: TIGR03085 family metal-binding protein [Streptosporangiaceae bacterium]|nr:TIGR03085 family metal-binding protein [Streptosporangiaceae bacterium]